MNIKLNNLAISIAGKTICKGLSAELHSGDRCAILGKNGAGKTTFLHCLCHLKDYDSGEILINNEDLLSFSSKKRAQLIGLLQQDHNYVFPLMVKELVLAGRYPYQNLFGKEHSSCSNFLEKIFSDLQLNQFTQRNILDLSGGEKQRVAIATILAQDPNVFLLDELCNHLDIHYQIAFLEFFKALTEEQNKIIFMTMHNLNYVAKYCNKVILLFDNDKAVYGTTEELMSANNLSRLYDHPIKITRIEDELYFRA